MAEVVASMAGDARCIYDTFPLRLPRGGQGSPVALSMAAAALSLAPGARWGEDQGASSGASAHFLGGNAGLSGSNRGLRSSSFDTNGGNGGNGSSSRGSGLLFSTSGKFQSEVFETKERSKVLSALRHRAKAVGGGGAAGARRSALLPLAPTKFTADDVVRTGVLTKQGSWRRNWKTVRQALGSFFLFMEVFVTLMLA